MKKITLGVLLFLFCFTPLCYSSVTEHPPVLSLNHMSYKPQYTPILLNGTLYLSVNDLALMTYGHFHQDAETCQLVIQNHGFDYSFTTYTLTLDNHRFLPELKPYLSKDQVLFYPITFLDAIDYPYAFEENHFKLCPLMPYSTATDHPMYHRTLPTTYTSYAQIFSPILKPLDMEEILTTAKQNRSYVSIISIQDKINCLPFIQKLVNESPLTTVYLRHIDVSGKTPVLSDFEQLPLTYGFSEDTLTLHLNKQTTLPCNCFWIAYNPYQGTTDIDLNKSLDVMLMRTLYEYYRDSYDIKDNLYISPLTQITYDRSDYMTYSVYFEHDTDHLPYEVVLYKQSTADTVTYYIDLRCLNQMPSF